MRRPPSADGGDGPRRVGLSPLRACERRAHHRIVHVFTVGFGSWSRRLSGRNPLVRVSDRIEAVAILLVVAVALLAAPIAGAVGTAVHDSLVHRYASDRASRQQVTATVTADGALEPRAYEEPFLTPIRWNFAGVAHTAEVRSYHMKAGEQLSIWVDTTGDRTTKPLTDENAATQAVVTGFGLWFAAVGAASAIWTVLRLRLNRSRYAAWDRELDDLADNGGRTNRNA